MLNARIAEWCEEVIISAVAWCTGVSSERGRWLDTAEYRLTGGSEQHYSSRGKRGVSQTPPPRSVPGRSRSQSPQGWMALVGIAWKFGLALVQHLGIQLKHERKTVQAIKLPRSRRGSKNA
jgi:hypothetical protein